MNKTRGLFQIRSVHVLLLAVLLPFSTVLTTPVFAAINVDREFEFASGLVERGFPDFANRVVNNILRLHPDETDRASRIRGEILVAQRRFEDAETLLNEMQADHPQRDALQLHLANGFFRAGRVDDAQRLYDDFFGRFKDEVPEDPDLRRFFLDASYRYGQMMDRMGRRKDAAIAFQRLLDVGLEDDTAQRRLMVDLASIYLQLGREATGSEKEDYLNRAFVLAEEIQWGGYDLWFGQSIGIMAHVELARGKEDDARQLLRHYMNDLNQIDEMLREQNVSPSISPVASARFLLGELDENQVTELRNRNAPESEVLPVIQRALTEFYNVFGRYGTSEWGSEAATRGRALVDLLEQEYGRRVNIDFGQHIGVAAQAQFVHADDLFRQNEYAAAVDEYLQILNAFPEEEPSIRALANLLMSYVHLEEELYVRTVASYMAERFAGDDVAARGLLMAGREYVNRQNEPKFEWIFETYLAGFPDHDRAPQLLFDMARRREAAGERGEAIALYTRIIETYPEDRFALRALLAKAMAYHRSGDFEEAIVALTRYAAEASPGHERVRAHFLIADAHQRKGAFMEAVQAYGRVIRMVSQDGSPDNAQADDREKNQELLERALFFVGHSFARITEPEDQVPTFRERAILAYDQFLSRYPRSSLAPRAMRDKGSVQLAMGVSEAAAATFEQLAQEYPDSEEGRSALFSLVRSAFEIDRPDIARDAFRRMMETPDAFSPEEFTRIGQLMLDNNLFDEVIPAYQRVVAQTEDRRMLELALFGLAQAYSYQGDHAQAVKVINDLLERFPNSAFFFDARFIKSDAYREMGELTKAHEQLADILQLSQDNYVSQKAQYSLGQLQILQDDKKAALASFQRIALLQNPSDTKLRPLIENSLLKSIELMMQLQRYQDVEDVSVQFLADFAQSDRVEEVRRARAEARRLAVR